MAGHDAVLERIHELWFGGYYAELESLATQVVEAAHARTDERAIAGVMLALSVDMQGRVIEEARLGIAIDACIAEALPYYAACGLRSIADAMIARGDRDADAVILRAAALFDEAGSRDGGPASLKLLARRAITGGDLEAARGHLERALVHLALFPFSPSARRMERELRELLAGLPGQGR
jgi:hypothetical protein